MEGSPNEAVAEAESLVNGCLAQAARLLNEQGGDFHPFSAWLDEAGTPHYTLDAGKHLAAADQRELLDQGLRDLAAQGALRAGAVCLIATMTQGDSETGEEGDPIDAVFIQSEHRDGEAWIATVPFERGWGLRRRWKFGEPLLLPGWSFIFGKPEAAS